MKYEEVIRKGNPSQTHEELNDLLLQIEEIKPKVIVEIGVHRGGSLYVWKEVFNPDILIGIDTEILPEAEEVGGVMLKGNSQDPEVFYRVVELLNLRNIDFLFLDGSHYYPDVKKDFEMYYPLVRQGGAIGFHDVVLTGNDTCQVYKFWNEIKVKYKTLTISYKDKIGPAATGTGVLFK